MLKGSILQKLRDAHGSGQSPKRPLNFGVYYKNTLVALCHALEDSILTGDYEPLMITAFQRGRWYLQEADRYGTIADRAHQIVILAAPDGGFADHPTSQRENVTLVNLEEHDPVAQEWHLIIVSPRYTAMVLCQELSDEDYQTSGIPTHDLERKFYGLWTFEPGLVQETAELAIAHIQPYNPSLAATLQQQLDGMAAQFQEPESLCELPTTNHLGDIVTRVVDYLQTSQQSLPNGADTHPATLDKNLISNELQAFLRISQLIDQTDLSNPMRAAEVATLAEAMGQLLDLPAWQIHRLRLAGLLHRIAFLQSLETELKPGSTPRYEDGYPVALSCPLVPGTQILRTMNRMKAIATILTHQTEHWDGSGLPAGLLGDEIPVESRILGLVACFQHRLADEVQSTTVGKGTLQTATPDHLSQVLATCQAEAGQRWDPKLVDALALLVNGFHHGLSLSVSIPKIAAGLWLLDSHSDEDLLQSLTDTVNVR